MKVLVVVLNFTLGLSAVTIIISTNMIAKFMTGVDVIRVLSALKSTFITGEAAYLFVLALPIVKLYRECKLGTGTMVLVRGTGNLSAKVLLDKCRFVERTAVTVNIALNNRPRFIEPLVDPVTRDTTVIGRNRLRRGSVSGVGTRSTLTSGVNGFFKRGLFVTDTNVLLVTNALRALNVAMSPVTLSGTSVPITMVTFMLYMKGGLLLSGRLDGGCGSGGGSLKNGGW